MLKCNFEFVSYVGGLVSTMTAMSLKFGDTIFYMELDIHFLDNSRAAMKSFDFLVSASLRKMFRVYKRYDELLLGSQSASSLDAE